MGVLKSRFCVDMIVEIGIYLLLVRQGYDAYTAVLLTAVGVCAVFSCLLQQGAERQYLCVCRACLLLCPPQGSVGMFVVYRELLKVVDFISRCEVLCVMYLYSGCDGYCVFCLTCDACNYKCICMGRCIFVSYVHPVQALRVVFCMTYNLLVLVWDVIGDHMDETVS